MFCGWVPMSFGGIVGCQNCIVISDCDGIYVGELGSPTLRLLLGCVNIEGSSRHAKLVSWSSRERNWRDLTHDDLWTYRSCGNRTLKVVGSNNRYVDSVYYEYGLLMYV
jgi:hypothetical protein